MNEEETKILMKWHFILVNELYYTLEEFLDNLLGHETIDNAEYEHFLAGTDPRQRCSEIILLLPVRCKVETFLSIIRQVNISLYERICKDFEEIEITVPKSLCRIELDDNRGTFLERLHDKIFEKVHDSRNVHMLKKMLSSAYYQLRKNKNLVLKDHRTMADFCFVLMDALTVNDRTYSTNLLTLWQHRLFSKMKKLIPDATNPQLLCIWYYSRYGMALALGNKREKGLDHVQVALQDAMMMQKGRYLGNCIFACVNIMLQHYSGQENEKRELLKSIESGIEHFMDESEECRLSWRHVYLVKKAFCHLGIDYFMKDIPTTMISSTDMEIARSCLNEMEKTLKRANTRRKIHYLRARSKLEFLSEKDNVAMEMLQKAVKLCAVGGFNREEETLKQILEFLLKQTERNICLHGHVATEYDVLYQRQKGLQITNKLPVN